MVHIPKRTDELGDLFAGMIRICRLRGWMSKASFEEDVKRMIEHLEDWHVVQVWGPNSLSQAAASRFRYVDNGASC